MNCNLSKTIKQMKLKMFQEGGAVAPEEQGQDPMAELVNMASQALESNDPNLAMQVCQALVQLAEQATQQQQAAEAGAEEVGAEEGEPVYKMGGKLVRRIKA